MGDAGGRAAADVQEGGLMVLQECVGGGGGGVACVRVRCVYVSALCLCLSLSPKLAGSQRGGQTFDGWK